MIEMILGDTSHRLDDIERIERFPEKKDFFSTDSCIVLVGN